MYWHTWALLHVPLGLVPFPAQHVGWLVLLFFSLRLSSVIGLENGRVEIGLEVFSFHFCLVNFTFSAVLHPVVSQFRWKNVSFCAQLRRSCSDQLRQVSCIMQHREEEWLEASTNESVPRPLASPALRTYSNLCALFAIQGGEIFRLVNFAFREPFRPWLVMKVHEMID